MSHLNESPQYEGLNLAASAVSAVVVAKQIPHGFIGGYAVSLLGGGRTTKVRLRVSTPNYSDNYLFEWFIGCRYSSRRTCDLCSTTPTRIRFPILPVESKDTVV